MSALDVDIACDVLDAWNAAHDRIAARAAAKAAAAARAAQSGRRRRG